MAEELLQKEAEYHRINDEIEQKTNVIMKQIQNVLVSHDEPAVPVHGNLPRDSSSEHQLKVHDLARKKSKAAITFDRIALPGDEAFGSREALRILQSQVQALRSDLAKIQEQYNAKDGECCRLREAARKQCGEQKKLQKQIISLQEQLTKQQKTVQETYKLKKESDTQLAECRKELENVRRDLSQTAGGQNSLDLRLQRALDDSQRLKEHMRSVRQEQKSALDAEKQRYEELLAANKVLEKQKAELIKGFRKQLQLIDVLKKQKVHLEAARLLQFTEAEFIRLLDWKPSDQKLV